MSTAIQRRSRIVDVDPFEGSREAVRVALSAHFAVGDEIEPRAFLVSDRKYCGVILRLFQKLRRNAPKLFARIRGGKRPASLARSISQSGCG
jgi:hypothetical protein